MSRCFLADGSVRTNLTEQNASTRQYDYGELGRQTQDRVITLGAASDQNVRWRDVSASSHLLRIEYGCDRASNRTSRENPSDPNREHDWLHPYDGLDRGRKVVALQR